MWISAKASLTRGSDEQLYLNNEKYEQCRKSRQWQKNRTGFGKNKIKIKKIHKLHSSFFDFPKIV